MSILRAEFPEVHLIAAVDKNNNTVYKNKPIGWHPSVSNDTRKLDQAILRETIEQIAGRNSSILNDPIGANTIPVMGINCFNELKHAQLYKKVLSDNCEEFIVTSVKDGDKIVTIYKNNAFDNPDYMVQFEEKGNNKVSDFHDFIMNYAITEKYRNVLVLGGRSVYNTFIKTCNYVQFHQFVNIPKGDSDCTKSIDPPAFVHTTKDFGKNLKVFYGYRY